MSDNEQLDVLVAVYLIPDLAQQDFDVYTRLAEDGKIVTDGVAVVIKDATARCTSRRPATTSAAREPRRAPAPAS